MWRAPGEPLESTWQFGVREGHGTVYEMDLRKEGLRGGPQACCYSSGKDVAAWCGYGASKVECTEENLGETFQKKIHWVLQWGEVRQEQESRCGLRSEP